MKKQGHPDYQEILFVDSSTGTKFVCGSTLKPKEKEMFEGREYPVYRVAISSASHPFFTGSKQFVDAEKRVDRFLNRYAKKREQEQTRIQNEEEREALAKESAKKRSKKK